MTGASHFSEVFFTDVRMPHERVLGEVNGGWGVAMTTLANERTMMGGGSSGPVVDRPHRAGPQGGRRRRPDHPAGPGGVLHASADHDATSATAAARAPNQGLPPGPEASVRKVFAAWNLKHNGELALAVQRARRDAARRRRARGRSVAAVVPRRPVHPHRRRQRRDPAQRDRASARSACPPSRGSTRGSRSGSCDGRTRSTPVQPVAELSPEQQERRRRLIDAAFELGAEGGYEAVQMRSVSETANVAMATIYRYFSSKDHLLVGRDDGVDRPAARPGGAVAAAGRHRGRPDGRRAAARVPGDGAPAEAVARRSCGRCRRPTSACARAAPRCRATSRRWATTSWRAPRRGPSRHPRRARPRLVLHPRVVGQRPTGLLLGDGRAGAGVPAC